jgi:phage shock protein A
MGIFERIARIIRANINEMLSKAEDPELMLNELIREMEEDLAEAKSQTTSAIADLKVLEKKYSGEKSEVEKWTEKAKLALKEGREDLAKEAVSRKIDHEALMKEYALQVERQRVAVERLKSGLNALEGKIDEAKRKRDLLVAKLKTAEASETINETLSGIEESPAIAEFERMEEKVLKIEARADALSEMTAITGSDIEAELEALGSGDVEEELLALKTDMGIESLPSGEEEKEYFHKL